MFGICLLRWLPDAVHIDAEVTFFSISVFAGSAPNIASMGLRVPLLEDDGLALAALQDGLIPSPLCKVSCIPDG